LVPAGQLVLFFDSLRVRPEEALERYGLQALPSTHFLIPKRLLLWSWPRLHWPPLEMVAGRLDVVLSTNFAVYPVQEAKLVVMVHDLSAYLHPEWHFPARVREIGGHFLHLHEADHILTPSEHVRSQVIKVTGISPDCVTAIHLGVRERFCPLPAKVVRAWLGSSLGLEPGYILYLGNVDSRKNVDTLVRAYSGLPLEVQRQHPLLIAGAHGTDAGKVRQACLGCAEGTVRFLGPVDDADVPFLYRGAVLFVYPSWEEGFGLPPLEAMACGTATIISNTPALVETSGPGAEVFALEQPAELQSAMARLLQDADLREQVRQRGLRHAAQFSWRKTGLRTLELLYRLAQER